MKRICLIMVLGLSQICLSFSYGQNRPEKAAEQFFSAKLSTRVASAGFQFNKPVQFGNIWVFECDNPTGFVLVRNNDSCSIAGYSTTNRFTRDNRFSGPDSIILESLSKTDDSSLPIRRIKTKYNPVGPMIRTTWSQEGYFNYYCPEDPRGPDNHVYAGCAAVAMGQIIRYFGKFNDFQVSAVMEDHTYGTLTATLGNHDWTRMENRPITIDTEVSGLLYGLGVLVDMGYGPTGSSTSNFKVYDGFKKLKYFNAIRMVRGTTTPEVWIKNFHENIADFQPVYVSGSGHSFICDGIDEDGFFHFNLGWYGYGDGYYPLNEILSINPSEAIFDLWPYSNNLPPANLILDSTGGQKILQWEKNRLATVNPLNYRVYLNDTAWFDTPDTYLNTIYLPEGNHEIMVTAIYPQGESVWIGPIAIRIEGSPVTIPDIALRSAIMEGLFRENILPVTESPTTNQLLKLQRLDIRDPANSLAGLENCRNLQVVTITPENTNILNLDQLSLLRRLKWLELKNIQTENINRLGMNTRLIHLDLNRTPAGNLGFLRELTGLIGLSLIDLPIPDPQIFSEMKTLKNLTISGCNLTTATFIQSLTNLETADLSRNQLTRFRLSDRLPELFSLNLSHNQINDLFFLEFIPNIQHLNLSSNLINRFITGLNFKHIRELTLDNNLIDSLWVGVPMSRLVNLSLHNNKIRDISQMRRFAPQLTKLGISHNNIKRFWDGSLQELDYLDLSNNSIGLINDLISNPMLRHINLSYNQITDIYSLFDHSNSQNIQYLDLTGNPLSSESLNSFAPSLQQTTDTLILPDSPQVFSPCSPLPVRGQTISLPSAELSWMPDHLPLNSYFEVHIGDDRDSLKLAGHSEKSGFLVDTHPGRRYFWRVRTVLPDTSFFSGLFNFQTYEPLTLPFIENFENYPSFGFFSELAKNWIRSVTTPTFTTDGRVDPYRKSEGRQSLKLANSSDLKLPLGHLYQSILYISMQLLIPDGCLGSVRLNDLNGASLEMFFKSNKRCDILINNQLVTETQFPVTEWFSVQINLYSKGGDIWVKLNNTDLQIPWSFTGSVVHLDEIEFTPASGPNWPTEGQPLFYVDELQIKASGSVGLERIPLNQEFLLFPNPCDDFAYLILGGVAINPVICIFDSSGKVFHPDLLREGSDRWKISFRDMVPGIYFIRVITDRVIHTRKILIL